MSNLDANPSSGQIYGAAGQRRAREQQHGALFQIPGPVAVREAGADEPRDPNKRVEWTVKATKPGKFAASAEIAATGNGSFRIVVGDQSLQAKATDTGNSGRFGRSTSAKGLI